MARQQVEPIKQDESLVPVASPVSSYVRPATPAKSSLWDIAEGLGKLDSGLQSFINQRKAQDDENARLQGEMDFYKGNEAGMAEAVRTGQAPNYRSPAYVKGYKAAEGSRAGFQLAQKFAIDFETWGGKNSEDPQAFDKFFQGWLKENLPENADPALLPGLLPHIRSIQQSGTAGYIKYRVETTARKAIEARTGEIGSALDAASVTGGGVAGKPNYPAVFEAAEKAREEYLKTGGEDIVKYDRDILSVVAAGAVEKADPRILDFFDRKVPGQDYTWADTPEGKKLKMEALGSIERARNTAATRAREEQERKDKQELQALRTEAIDHLLANPNAPLPDALVKKATRLDGDFKMNALEWAKTIAEGNSRSDPEKLLRFYEELYASKGSQEVFTRAANSGLFKNKADFNEAWRTLQDLSKPDPGLVRVLDSEAARTIVDTIKQRTTPTSLQDPFGLNKGWTNSGLAAKQYFQRALTDWYKRNPDASLEQQLEAANRIGKLVLDGIKAPPGADVVEEGSFSPPDELRKEQPPKPDSPFMPGRPVEGPPQKPEVNGPPQAPATSPEANPIRTPAGPLAPEEAAPFAEWQKTLNPRQRAMIEEAARKKGTTTEGYSRALWRRLQQNAAPPQAPAPAPAQPALPPAPAAPPPGRQGMVAPDGTHAQPASLVDAFVDAMGDTDAAVSGMAAIERAMGGGLGLIPQASAPGTQGQPVVGMATAYIPIRGGDSMQGGYESSRPGPDGVAEVRTVDDYIQGRSPYITLAGNPEFYGRRYLIKEITVRLNGQDTTLRNVPAVVHDTGSAFRNAPEGRFDVPFARDLGMAEASAQPYSKRNLEFIPLSNGEEDEEDGNPALANRTIGGFVAAQGKTYTVGSHVDMNIDKSVASVLDEAAQANPGVPFKVISGYRDPAYNRSVRGSRGSQHLHGKAVDVDLKGLTPQQQQALVASILANPNVKGFGYYPKSNTIHFDTRSGGKVAWGQSRGGESVGQGWPSWLTSLVQGWQSDEGQA